MMSGSLENGAKKHWRGRNVVADMAVKGPHSGALRAEAFAFRQGD
jgi:hypothetical protein